MPSPIDAKQAEHGDMVALLVGGFDPPTIDHARAVEALLALPDIKHVWVAPRARGAKGTGSDHVRAMATMFCADMMTSTRAQVTCCTAGLDKGIESPAALLTLCRVKFPYLRFTLAAVAPDQEGDIVVSLRNQPSGKNRVIRLDDFLPATDGIHARIADGRDESRNICAPVWRYIQTHRLWRGKNA